MKSNTKYPSTVKNGKFNYTQKNIELRDTQNFKIS